MEPPQPRFILRNTLVLMFATTLPLGLPIAAPAAYADTAPAADSVAQMPPVKGMVWVNTATRVFHREGDIWYGRTKEGKFMTRADAVKAGIHEAGK